MLHSVLSSSPQTDLFIVMTTSYQTEELLIKICEIQSLLTTEGNMLDSVNIFIYLFTAIGLSPGGSCYFTCKQNMKLVTTRFKSRGLHEKHVVATWNVGNHLSICL